MRTTARRLVAGLALITPLLAAAPAAQAGGATYDLDHRHASALWVSVGTTPGLPGNVHRGSVNTAWDDDTSTHDTSGVAYEAWTCPRGVLPPELGVIHDEPPVETPCTFEGEGWTEVTDAEVVVDEKLATARITGVATFGREAATVDVTWTGVGPTWRDVSAWRVTDDDGARTHITVLTSRSATAAGTVGPVVLDGTAVTRAGLGRQVDTFH